MTPKKVSVVKAENGYLVTDPGDPNEYEDPKHWVTTSYYDLGRLLKEIFEPEPVILAKEDEEIPY